jgi:hypothetical protein
MRNTLLLLGLGIAALSGCESTTGTSSSSVNRQVVDATPVQATIVHAVFFELKPGLSDAQVRDFIEGCYRLADIPSVRQIEVGPRDERMQREVNDQKFGIGLVVYFDDKAGHDLYQDHPIHLEMIQNHREKWAGVRVFDFTTDRIITR